MTTLTQHHSLIVRQCLQRRCWARAVPRRLYGAIAIARELPNSFGDALAECASSEKKKGDELAAWLERAREQHAMCITKLREILQVLVLPPSEDHPDCCFVEDAVVTVGNRAMLTRMGHPDRQGEVDTIKPILEQLGVEVTDMRDLLIGYSYL